MKWKLILLLMLIAIIALGYVYSIPPKPTLEISRMYNVNLQPGETIQVNITVSNVQDLFSYRINLAWDPYVLKVATGDQKGWIDPFTRISYNIYEGPFLRKFSNATRFLINEVNNKKGTITALYGGFVVTGTSASGSGVLAIINFTCVHPGLTTIEITGGDPGEKHALLGKSGGEKVMHDEVCGVVSPEGPLPAWTKLDFLITVIVIEVIVLTILSSIIVALKRPKRKRVREEEEELFEEF